MLHCISLGFSSTPADTTGTSAEKDVKPSTSKATDTKLPLSKSTLSASRVYHDVLYTEGKRKAKNNSDLIEKLIKLDEEAAKRSEEQTRKWLEMEEEREMRRLKMEQQHEERMMTMFGTLIAIKRHESCSSLRGVPM